MNGWTRPSAVPDQPTSRDRIIYWGTVEIPDHDNPHRYACKHSPSFPLERDIRDWARLHIHAGEVRIWQTRIHNGHIIQDTELNLLEVA